MTQQTSRKKLFFCVFHNEEHGNMEAKRPTYVACIIVHLILWPKYNEKKMHQATFLIGAKLKWKYFFLFSYFSIKIVEHAWYAMVM